MSRKISNTDIFAPWSITISVWTLIILLFLLYGDTLNPLTGKFYYSVFLWVTSFSISSLMIYKLPYVEQNSYKIQNSKLLCPFSYSKIGFKVALILSFIFTPIYFKVIVEALQGDYFALFQRLRENSNAGFDMGITSYVKELNSVILIAMLWKYPKINKWIFSYVLIVNILGGIAIMEKGSIFYVLISYLFIFYKKGYITSKKIGLYGGLFLVGAFLMNTMRANHFGEGDFMRFFSLYVLSSSVAFETLSSGNAPYWGANTFPFFYIFDNIINGTNIDIVQKLKPFVYVPIPTNVYTVMQPYYEDFGYTGVFVFGIINGIIMGYIYRKMTLGNPIYCCLYTYIVQILILQFFQENFFISLSVFIQTAFWSYLIFGLKKYSFKISSYVYK